MKIKLTILLFTFIAILHTSCKKWLDISPADQFSSNDLYINTEGYKKSLNGIYLEMTNATSYGENLSSSSIDVLAHYYHINPLVHNHKFNPISTYAYTDAANKQIFSDIWSKNYALIANCNVLLENIPAAPTNILPDPYYNMIKGEALALRGFFHFDILRLFGPLWTEEALTENVLPYARNSKAEVHPFINPSSFIDLVINDLNEALELLDNDPIRTEGVRNTESPTGDNFFYLRQYRLNYYAIKSLLARAYLWKKENTLAYNLAKEIIEETQEGTDPIFPFVKKENATHITAPDRVFSTEVIFSLYDAKRTNLFNTLFSSTLTTQLKLSFNLDNTTLNRVTELYDDENDYRRAIWQLRTDNSKTSLTNIKYEFLANAPGRFMIPLIRISELYLIIAETSPSSTEAENYLNIVRRNRNSVDLHPANREALLRFITNEYRKEFIGEGQMFYYYKRTQSTTIPRVDQLTGTENMFLSNYVVPLPDNEISIRNK